MNRLLAFVLVASVGNASAAFAGESLLTAGARHVKPMAAVESASTPRPAGATVTAAGQKSTPSFQAEGGNLSKSGMGKGKKTLIYVGLAVAFAASVWTIDHHVLDVTPSSLGTRQD